MLEDVQSKQDRHLRQVHEVLLLYLSEHKLVARVVIEEECPSDTLDCLGGITELGLELVKAAEILLKLIGELPAGCSSSFPGRCHVRPEDGVEYVPVDVEAVVSKDGPCVNGHFAFARLVELVESGVGTVDVRLVMLVVVKCHDLLRDVGFKRLVRIRKWRKFVLCHRVGPSIELVKTLLKAQVDVGGDDVLDPDARDVELGAVLCQLAVERDQREALLPREELNDLRVAYLDARVVVAAHPPVYGLAIYPLRL